MHGLETMARLNAKAEAKEREKIRVTVREATRRVKCPRCGGDGLDPIPLGPDITCELCEGDGEVMAITEREYHGM